MQHRCYTCGFVFSHGLPPMEALTDQQFWVVSNGSRATADDEVRIALIGTHFEGLGAANFCDPCLLAILDNPPAFTETAALSHRLEQGEGCVWCSCGLTYAVSKEYPGSRTAAIFYRHDWVQINRLRMRHISDAHTMEGTTQ